jgi:hypothetical protein
MALSANQPRTYRAVGYEGAYGVQASSTIYVGSAVSIDSGGEAGPLATGDSGFLGFARKKADNSSGSADDIDAAIITEGLIELTVTGLNDNDDAGDIVYATDDGTFTLTASGAMKIGRVFQILNTTTNRALVRFQALLHEHNND